MRGDLTLRIMDYIADGVYAATAGLAGYLEAGYGASLHEMEWASGRNVGSSYSLIRERIQRRKRHQRFACMLNYLKRNGLIRERRIGDIVRLYLTAKGRAKRTRMKKEQKAHIPVVGYEAIPGKKIIIIAYDIPDKMRRYRNWLRMVLRRLGFKRMQRSVWVGRVIIPERLLADFVSFQLQEHIEIVEVGSGGTIEKII